MKVSELKRGDGVTAAKLLDPEGAYVEPGTKGIVFEVEHFYGDGGGPMVRWFDGATCNIYEGDITTNKALDIIRANEKEASKVQASMPVDCGARLTADDGIKYGCQHRFGHIETHKHESNFFSAEWPLTSMDRMHRIALGHVETHTKNLFMKLLDNHDDALCNHEHGGKAAHKCVEDLRKILGIEEGFGRRRKVKDEAAT